MTIEKYRFTQDKEYSVEVSTTLTELQKEFDYLSKKTVKDWVLSGAKIKSGKIKLYKKQ